MPHYMFRWRYTGKSIRSICAGPDDRTHLIKVLVEDFKGKLVCHYYSFGQFHGLFIAEFPDNQSARACAIYCSKTGGFTHFEALPLLTAAEAQETLQIAHDTQSAYYIFHSALHPEYAPKDPGAGN